jgi:hypothetical protein
MSKLLSSLTFAWVGDLLREAARMGSLRMHHLQEQEKLASERNGPDMMWYGSFPWNQFSVHILYCYVTHGYGSLIALRCGVIAQTGGQTFP